MSPKWSSSLLLVTLSTCLLFASSALSKCECGYSVQGQGTYTDAFEADFFRQDPTKNDPNWRVSTWAQPYDKISMQYSRDNVISKPLPRSSSSDPGLQLFVRGYTGSGVVSTAEIATTRGDMHYGSYRAAIKTTAVSGTCGSVFWMRNNQQTTNEKQEIDFEFLGYEEPQRIINIGLHHGVTDSSFDKPRVPFSPADGFHEYRFDWSPGAVTFYVDGQFIKNYTNLVPTVPGNIILNHWSHGQSGWELGPPKQDALMTVAYVKAYFNTLSPAPKCVDPKAKDAICEVPNQLGPVTPETPTTFLTAVSSSLGDGEPIVPVNPTPTSTAEPVSTEPPSTYPSSGMISPDNKCGGDEGFTCLNGPAGDCCSSAGWWYVCNCSSVLPD
ncbi:MAG: hypothetical protein Q9226_006178 [Calogaya cf. arnoldii]